MLFNFGGNIFCTLGNLYVLILIARAILSWFPVRSDSPVVPVARFLNIVTEPVLAPFRRVIPPAGMFDVSFIVAVFVVSLFVNIVICRL